MELYGGGMTGRPTNYRLGGRIARSNLERAVNEERIELKEKQEEAARKQQKAGFLGQLGQIAGGAIGSIFGPVGTGIGAALGSQLGQSTYQGTDVGEGRFLTQSREDLQENVDDFKEGMLTRSAIAGLQAAIMPEFYKGVGEFAGDIADKGLGFLRGRFQTPVGLTEGSEIFMKNTTAAGVNPFQDAIEQLTSSNLVNTEESPLSFGQTFKQAADEGGIGSTFMFKGKPYLVEFADRDMNSMAGMRGGGLINMMLPQMQTGGAVNPYGYGTMTDPLQALRQMGMGATADDPRLQQYLNELPQFGMGYAQQIGDIQTGGQQTLRDMRGQAMQAAGQRGFSGSGIGQRQMATQLGDLRTDVARQRRGVIEGFQSDLLGAIRDIESAGEFTFNTGPAPYESLGMTKAEYDAMLAAEAAKNQELVTQFEEEEQDGMLGFTTGTTNTGSQGGGNPYTQSGTGGI